MQIVVSKLSTIFLFVSLRVVSGKWQLTWSDDFDGPTGSPPGQKWSYDFGNGVNGWGNMELEYYTNSTNNSVLNGKGQLEIIARFDRNPSHTCWYGQCNYTSARLTTFQIFNQTYGRFEIRAKVPSGKGLWPAFWLLGDNITVVGWPQCGEIDILEVRGSQTNRVSGTIHGPGYSGGGGITSSYKLPNKATFSEDFHVIAIEWRADNITWLVDDHIYATKTYSDLPPGAPWVFDHPFFILLNLAVGGLYDGYPDGKYTFPQKFYIDYIRVYKLI